MVKNHIKTLATPRTWPVKRKEKIWITRPNSGAHPLEATLPLNVIMKDILNITTTSKETKYVLNNKQVLVDGRRRKDKKFSAGIMDTISFLDTNKHYRISYNEYGKLVLLDIPEKEATTKPVRIMNKTYIKGKLQLNCNDGRNILVDKNEYKTGDSLLIELPSQKVLKHLPLEKGAYIFLVGGKHLGAHGKVESIQEAHITFKSDKKLVKTLTKYALVIGKDKPEITT